MRTTYTAIAAAIFALILAVTARTTSEDTASKEDEDTAVEDEETTVILRALETMFTWNFASDTSPLDAYRRAAPYLTPDLAANGTPFERDHSVRWNTWAKPGYTDPLMGGSGL